MAVLVSDTDQSAIERQPLRRRQVEPTPEMRLQSDEIGDVPDKLGGGGKRTGIHA